MKIIHINPHFSNAFFEQFPHEADSVQVMSWLLRYGQENEVILNAFVNPISKLASYTGEGRERK